MRRVAAATDTMLLSFRGRFRLLQSPNAQWTNVERTHKVWSDGCFKTYRYGVPNTEYVSEAKTIAASIGLSDIVCLRS